MAPHCTAKDSYILFLPAVKRVAYVVYRIRWLSLSPVLCGPKAHSARPLWLRTCWHSIQLLNMRRVCSATKQATDPLWEKLRVGETGLERWGKSKKRQRIWQESVGPAPLDKRAKRSREAAEYPWTAYIANSEKRQQRAALYSSGKEAEAVSKKKAN